MRARPPGTQWGRAGGVVSGGAQRLRSESSEEGDCGLSFPGRCAPGPQDGYASRPPGLAMPLRHCAPLRGLPMPNSGIGSFSLVPRSQQNSMVG